MTVTIHKITIGVREKTNIQSEIEKVMQKLKANLEEGQGDFIEFATKQTKFVAKLETQKFTFKGDLERGISHRYFRRMKKGEVFVKSDQQKKAIMNEFGQEPPTLVPNKGKMRSWVEQKAPSQINKKFIRVGFADGGSHVKAPNPQNRFWGITQQKIARDIENMFAHYIERAIERS